MVSLHDKKDPVVSLEDLCVRHVCKNLNNLTFFDGSKQRWCFPYPEFYISVRPAQKILIQLCKRNALDDDRMCLFSPEFLNLTSPIIKEVSVSSSALRVLKEFRLSGLSAVNLPNVNLNSLLGCLGEWTVKNLISLNVTGTSILSGSSLPILAALGRFKSLEVLNVSRTEFATPNLQIVADDLPNLRFLNISRTRVNDIRPLLSIRDRLTGLVMHRLELEKREEVETLLHTIVQMHKLQFLDASDRHGPVNLRFDAVETLCSGAALPELTHIDLSGNQFGLRFEDARLLVENHPNLVFAGFACWLSSHEHELDGIYKLSLRYPKITMLGDRGDQLLLNTLTRNKDRAIYLQNALHCIFEATSNRESLKPDLLQAVLRVMRLHMRRMEMILAGTAVIYNLTRSEQSRQLPLELLNRVVRMTLTAMEKYHMNRQLQKNCLLTLCNDTVLYRATFNCNQCCELVFKNLIAFDDMHMKRMGVAIISILAAEISTAGLSELAKDRRRIQRLLTYIAEKCLVDSDLGDLGAVVPHYLLSLQLRPEGPPIFDTTLRFTLSALWNLTDECPEACLAFVQEGGLRIYEKVLKRFADQDEGDKNHVYTKCLGLLNNVAEVDQTRNTLLMDTLMDFFFKMLRHPNIQISYFAAGIIAHLSCLKDDLWLASLQTSKESHVRLLGQAVCNWQAPQSEMVAYRSFEPFEQLVLHPESRLEVHLWAVWAIHHILTRKEARYVPTLCNCGRLLSFLRYVVSVDEAMLCTNGCHRQSPSSLSRNDSEGHRLATFSQLINSEDMDADHRVEENGLEFLDALSWSSSLHSSTEPTPILGCAGDGCMLGSDGLQKNASFMRQRLPGGAAGVAFDHTEPVDKTTAGVSAFVGPDSAQLACARLIRSLAAEILAAVDRVQCGLPTTDGDSVPCGSHPIACAPLSAP